MAALSEEEEHERLVEQWRVRKLIKRLSEARGSGTSMISLIIPPKGRISQVSNMLLQESGTATSIKSRKNRLSVLSAIASTRERLKLYTRVPPNGLVIYCGTVVTDEGKEKKLAIHFEPFKPINQKMYICASTFQVEPLQKLLEGSSVYGFIVMDGHGCLYGTLTGNHCEVKYKFSVDLPKKQRKGGQSSVRFARLRMEARHNYLRKCAEEATKQFIAGDRSNVEKLVLAGSASFKNELAKSDLFDYRLKSIVLKVVDTAYGGINGFNQAIEMTQDDLANVRFVRERKLLSDYLEEIAQDTNKYCFGISDTMRALEMGAVSTLIVWEELELLRVEVLNPNTKDKDTLFLSPTEFEDGEWKLDKSTGVQLDVTEKVEFLEWLAENYKSFGTKLELITDRSPEGAQFVRGLGGIGGFLRWQINMVEMDEYLASDDEDESEYM